MGMDFNLVAHFIDELKPTNDFLEIGSSRGDDSTNIFGQKAIQHGRKMYSVDMDPFVITNAKSAIIGQSYESNIVFYNGTGEEFLEQNSDLKFSFVLLDNYDWNYWDVHNMPNFALLQQTRYQEILKQKMSNLNSQIAHLRQAILLTNMMASNAIVVCDDSWEIPNNVTYNGKCGAAIPYLVSIGFNVVFKESNGVVLRR